MCRSASVGAPAGPTRALAPACMHTALLVVSPCGGIGSAACVCEGGGVGGGVVLRTGRVGNVRVEFPPPRHHLSSGALGPACLPR
jgi:hypothetical protein